MPTEPSPVHASCTATTTCCNNPAFLCLFSRLFSICFAFSRQRSALIAPNRGRAELKSLRRLHFDPSSELPSAAACLCCKLPWPPVDRYPCPRIFMAPILSTLRLKYFLRCLASIRWRVIGRGPLADRENYETHLDRQVSDSSAPS